MARDSSPLSKRLKALAVRAGLPVESGQTNGQTPPAAAAPSGAPAADDEQPTGEFPAVAAADTPDEDRPTGEFPAVAESAPASEPPADGVSPAQTPTGATEAASPGPVPPPVRDEPTAAPADAPSYPTVPPIWTDSPAESQSPLTAETANGPTLQPPTLTSLDKAAEPAPEPAPEPSEPLTELHEVVSGPPAADVPEDAPTSRVAALDEALTLDAEPEPEPEPVASTEATDQPTGEQDEQATIDAASVSPSTETSADPPAAETPSNEVEPSADATDDDVNPTPAALPDATPQPADKLSLTGRIAAIRRRIRPEAAPVATAAAQPPTGAEEPPPPVTVVETPPAAAEPQHDEHFAKPSFSERAALRRRVKTLRARRDAGLLELGAITIDQRRFGDPTAGSLLRKRTDELVDLDNEIAAIEYALEEHASATAIAALGTVRCLGCGTLVGPVDRYCAHCGTPRPTDAARSDVRTDQGS